MSTNGVEVVLTSASNTMRRVYIPGCERPGGCCRAERGDSQTPPAKDYADRHNPFIYYSDIESSAARCQAHDVPYTQLAGDLTANSLPAFSFITPDTCDDGHDSPCSNGNAGGLHSMDAWLAAQVPALLSYLMSHNGLLVITFDEASPSDPGRCPCDPASFGGQIGALFLGPGVKAGQTVTTAYDHYSLLRTIEDSFGISEHLNQAGSATAMNDMFATPSATLPEAPWAVLLVVAAGLCLALLRARLVDRPGRDLLRPLV